MKLPQVSNKSIIVPLKMTLMDCGLKLRNIQVLFTPGRTFFLFIIHLYLKSKSADKSTHLQGLESRLSTRCRASKL